MKVYLAAPMPAVQLVRDARDVLLTAGHELTLDWTREMPPTEGVDLDPAVSAAMASAMLEAVWTADALVALATGYEGRGMFVELGAALSRAAHESAYTVAVVGDIIRGSVFYSHPAVTRFRSVEQCAAALRTAGGDTVANPVQ
ncbi:hypothetical protein H9L10_04280 [Phycicoccus endophyticus]|uniref:Nucleoside 2-deoxyribosyltransferase n=1 Tax=Phycicoccus endophyticus TaxID=1690220 RepID=A0A7G9R3T8_9MICO|nr:hypothetical protein [Phycicoccus endophyticus]NHI18091.1 hypothetical protein [Phycicoccus endophyticus]QNN50263.1 hypothetical protein H9L10_04280 [Phycicoccus endophyticus]